MGLLGPCDTEALVLQALDHQLTGVCWKGSGAVSKGALQRFGNPSRTKKLWVVHLSHPAPDRTFAYQTVSTEVLAKDLQCVKKS